ncbi:MAG TPA: hypothetical protein VLF40_04420 [Candidatus Saccharimonadales bacterium]|nr:hypothetical protein [Candidatus Saccharimonadales bacterium]
MNTPNQPPTPYEQLNQALVVQQQGERTYDVWRRAAPELTDPRVRVSVMTNEHHGYTTANTTGVEIITETGASTYSQPHGDISGVTLSVNRTEGHRDTLHLVRRVARISFISAYGEDPVQAAMQPGGLRSELAESPSPL